MGTNTGMLMEGQRMNERLRHKATYPGKIVNDNNLHITYVKMVSKLYEYIPSRYMNVATLEFNRWNVSPHNIHTGLEYKKYVFYS